jgi:hypothetical protein
LPLAASRRSLRTAAVPSEVPASSARAASPVEAPMQETHAAEQEEADAVSRARSSARVLPVPGGPLRRAPAHTRCWRKDERSVSTLASALRSGPCASEPSRACLAASMASALEAHHREARSLARRLHRSLCVCAPGMQVQAVRCPVS